MLQVTWSWPGRLDTPRRHQGRWQPWQRMKCGVPGHGGPPARAAVPILCIPSDINNDARFSAHAADARGPGLENLTETQKDFKFIFGGFCLTNNKILDETAAGGAGPPGK